MMRKFGLLSVLLLWVCISLQAARVDTLMVHSPSMKKTVEDRVERIRNPARWFICFTVMEAMRKLGLV